MRAFRTASLVAGFSLVLIGLPAGPAQAQPPDIGRQTLPANDGFAAMGGGTTGGAPATADHVYHVRTRKQLVDAFGQAGSAPKIIYVEGTIDANTDDEGNSLTCDDYASGTGYSLPGYLSAYDPATWGRTTVPSGPMEDARAAAQHNQAKFVQLMVPANTTIVGAGADATIAGGDLDISGVDNVIVRNLTVRGATDCFPQWDPTDGSTGNWNSEYDDISVINGATHVWIDHNTITDAPYYDDTEPSYFDRPFQQHDGATDITDAADLVTVSWNVYTDHDKLMLVGSTDSNSHGDSGHLRVTVHHNKFIDVGQRATRLRWGHNDIYDNYYVEPGAGHIDYQYSWGAGVNSHIYAQDNYFAFGFRSVGRRDHPQLGRPGHPRGRQSGEPETGRPACRLQRREPDRDTGRRHQLDTDAAHRSRPGGGSARAGRSICRRRPTAPVRMLPCSRWALHLVTVRRGRLCG